MPFTMHAAVAGFNVTSVYLSCYTPFLSSSKASCGSETKADSLITLQLTSLQHG